MADKRITDLFKEPIYFDPPDNPRDVIVEGSDAELSEQALRQKHQDIEHAARRYLKGHAPFLISAKLKGPFTERAGWKNPWRKERKTRRLQQKKALDAKEKRDGLDNGTDRLSRARRPEVAQTGERRQGLSKATSKLMRPPGRQIDLEDTFDLGHESDHLSRPQKFSRDASKNSTSQTAQQPRASTKTAVTAISRKDMPPPKQIFDLTREDSLSNRSEESRPKRKSASNRPIREAPAGNLPPKVIDLTTADALPERTGGSWLKKKIVSNKSLWETPASSTPTPGPVVSANERKRRAPIARTSSNRSARSSAAEPASHRTSSEWQHGQPSQISSFGGAYNSTGTDTRRPSFGSATGMPPRGLPSAGQTPVSDRNVMNTIVSASAGKRLSLADRQDSLFESSFDADSLVQDSSQKQSSRDQPWADHTRASSGTDFARPAKNNQFATRNAGGGLSRSPERDPGSNQDRSSRGEKIPEGTKSTYQDVDQNSLDEGSLLDLYQAGQLARSDVATPLSAQLGSFGKYQLSLPQFDFDNSRSQNFVNGDFAFSFNGGVSSEVPKTSIEVASRPASAHSQPGQNKSSGEESGRLQGKSQSLSAKDLSSVQAVHASKFVENSFHFSKAETRGRKGAHTEVRQGPRESTQGHSNVAEEVTRNDAEQQHDSRPGEARLRRSMTFEEDDSPGFMGPRQKRYKEKTKLKISQSSRQRESSTASKSEDQIGNPAEVAPRRGVSAKSDSRREDAVETSRPALSTFMTVNVNQEPTSPENLAQPGEAASILEQEVTKPPLASPKLVISAIIAEHISPSKPTSAPSSPEIANQTTSLTDPPLSQVSSPELKPQSDITDVHSSITKSKSQSAPKGLSSPHKSKPTEDSSKQEQVASEFRKPSLADESPSNPESADEGLAEDREVAQKYPARKITEPVVDNGNVAHKGLVASPIPNLVAASMNSSPKDSSTQLSRAEENVEFASKLHSSPKISTSSQSQMANKSREQALLQSPSTKETTEAGSERFSPQGDTNAHHDVQSSWSFNDTTLSLSRIDSSARLVTTPRATTPISHSALSAVESSAGPEENEGSPLSTHEHASSAPVQANPAEADIGLFSDEKSRENNGKASTQPSIAVEDVIVSSDDEEENIPSDRPPQIMALRNSFLSPIRKKKKRRPSKSLRKSLRKPTYRAYGSSSGSQIPEKPPAMVTEQVPTAKTSPIQALVEDPVAEVGIRAEPTAKPQSPWTEERGFTPNYALPVLKTAANNVGGDVLNSQIQSRSTNSRLASEDQTGWDESGFEPIPSHAPSNRSGNDVEPENRQQEHPLPHGDSEHSEPARSPSDEMSELRPFRTFATPSPPKKRKLPPTPHGRFPNTQALVDAAMDNPWASAKPASRKHVSFAPSDDEDETDFTTPRPEKRQRLISPPPPSDDSIGLDGLEDKLARRLREAKTNKLTSHPSSSPGADAMANMFIAADLQADLSTTSDSNGKRKSREIDDDDTPTGNGYATSSRPTKRQYRPSQTWDDDDDDELDAPSSFEITPNGKITPVKNKRATFTAKKTPRSSYNKGDAEEDIAALVENNLDEVIEDVSDFFKGWDVDEEVRRVNRV